MVDLNLWQLAYDDTLLEFGTHESGHPFTAQVVVGVPDREDDDTPHPSGDGLVMGRDLTRGRQLGFTGVHLTTIPPAVRSPGRAWVPPMDDAQTFEQAWRARAVRETPGKYATLTNVDRGRMVIGRPRPFQLDLALARRGWVTYSCVFQTVDDRFYDATEKVATTGVDPGSLDVMTFPVTFPFVQATPGESRTWVVNAGTDDAWPIVTFRRGGHPRLEFLNNAGGVDWTLEVGKNLADDEELVIDTRPWVRTVTLNGTAAPGLVRGSALAQARIKPGTHELRLVATDLSGLADVEVRWRDTFGSL